MFENIIGPLELKFLSSLVIAIVCGVLVGAERALKSKPAGIGTQTMVIAGSMLFAFLSVQLGGGDPARIAAQIVSGIGFLGAGIILKSEGDRKITNVTTAASIWYSAALGMAIGFGFYAIAIIGAITAAIVLRLPHINKSSV